MMIFGSVRNWLIIYYLCLTVEILVLISSHSRKSKNRKQDESPKTLKYILYYFHQL
jgi:hypothetical protein